MYVCVCVSVFVCVFVTLPHRNKGEQVLSIQMCVVQPWGQIVNCAIRMAAALSTCVNLYSLAISAVDIERIIDFSYAHRRDKLPNVCMRVGKSCRPPERLRVSAHIHERVCERAAIFLAIFSCRAGGVVHRKYVANI